MTGGQRGRALAWLMFVPAALLLTFAVRQRVVRPSFDTPFESPAEPDHLGDADPIAGWEGTVDLGEGCALDLRFEPLHPDPRRQRFDAEALCRALRPGEYSMAFAEGGPAPAEPWRLTISADGPATSLDRMLVTGLDGVRVGGFEPIVPTGTEPNDVELGPSDPLAGLLRFPGDVLTVNQRCDLVFWGPAPGGTGEAGSVPDLAVRIPGVQGPVTLGPKERAGSRSTQSLAVLDAALARDTTGESREDGSATAVDSGEAQPSPR